MGLIVNQIVGTAKGKIGNFVYRAKKTGESYISPLPKKYKKTNEIGAINNRSRFSMIVKFSSAVNDSPVLKSVWDYARKPGRAPYTKIYKDNHNYSHENYMNINAHITPAGRDLQITAMQLNVNNLKVEFNVFGNLFVRFKPPYIAVAMIHLYDPIDSSLKKSDLYHRFLTIEEEFDSFNFYKDKVNIFKFRSAKNTFKIINDYKVVVVYFAIICKKNNVGNMDWTKSNGTILKGAESYNEAREKDNKLTQEKNLPLKIPKKPIYNVRLR